MKYILFLSLFTISVAGYSQDEGRIGLFDKEKNKDKSAKGSEPFKKANTITILSSGDKSDLLNKLAVVLAEMGFGIHSKDVETGILTTTEYGKRNSNVTVKIVGVVKDGIVRLKGQFKVGMAVSISGVSTVPDYEEIRYGGMKGSPLRNAWDELDKVAKKVPGDHTYSID